MASLKVRVKTDKKQFNERDTQPEADDAHSVNTEIEAGLDTEINTKVSKSVILTT